MKYHGDLYGAAVDLLAQAGAVDRCPVHRNVCLDRHDEKALTRAFALASARIAAGDRSVSLERLETALTNAYGDSVFECAECEFDRRQLRRAAGASALASSERARARA